MSTLRTNIINANNTRALPPARYHLQHHNSLQEGKSKQRDVQPVHYATVTKKLLVPKPINEIPTAETKVKKVKKLISPASITWEKGHGTVERIDKKTGDIYHLVHKAAVYKNIIIEEQIKTKHTEIKHHLVRVKMPMKIGQKQSSSIVPCYNIH